MKPCPIEAERVEVEDAVARHRRRMITAWTDDEIGAWVVNLCRDFGADAATAHKVAGAFLDGVRTAHDVKEGREGRWTDTNGD